MPLSSCRRSPEFDLESFGGPLLVVLFYWFRFHTMKGPARSRRAPVSVWPRGLHHAVPGDLCRFSREAVAARLGLGPDVRLAHSRRAEGVAESLPGAGRDSRQRPPAARRAGCRAVPGRSGRHAELQRKLSRVGYQIDDFRAAQSTAIQSRFLKISALMLHLERWAAGHDAFMERNSDLYADLLAVYDPSASAPSACSRAAPRSTVRSWRTAMSSQTIGRRSTSSRPDTAWSASFSSPARPRRDACWRICARTWMPCSTISSCSRARAAFAGEWTSARSRRRLGVIGFTLEPDPPGHREVRRGRGGLRFRLVPGVVDRVRQDRPHARRP